MSKDLTPERALIFRIIHKGNLPDTLANGCRCRNAATGKFVEIGNQELIQRRGARNVPCGPGGTLSDYVPFYFTPYTPMLYNIKTGYGVPKHPGTDLVILVSSLYRLRENGIQFVFTDRHAYLKAAQFSTDLEDLDWIIWPALQARDFRKDDADKFEKYQAEALVYRHVPVKALLGIVCYSDDVKAAILTETSKHQVTIKVVAQPKWYL